MCGKAEQLLTMSGTKVEALHTFGVPDASNGGRRGLPRGLLRGELREAPERRPAAPVPRGRGGGRAPPRSSAARPTSTRRRGGGLAARRRAGGPQTGRQAARRRDLRRHDALGARAAALRRARRHHRAAGGAGSPASRWRSTSPRRPWCSTSSVDANRGDCLSVYTAWPARSPRSFRAIWRRCRAGEPEARRPAASRTTSASRSRRPTAACASRPARSPTCSWRLAAVAARSGSQQPACARHPTSST